jgi:hypothetical protein
MPDVPGPRPRGGPAARPAGRHLRHPLHPPRERSAAAATPSRSRDLPHTPKKPARARARTVAKGRRPVVATSPRHGRPRAQPPSSRPDRRRQEGRAPGPREGRPRQVRRGRAAGRKHRHPTRPREAPSSAPTHSPPSARRPQAEPAEKEGCRGEGRAGFQAPLRTQTGSLCPFICGRRLARGQVRPRAASALPFVASVAPRAVGNSGLLGRSFLVTGVAWLRSLSTYWTPQAAVRRTPALFH